MPHRNAGTVRTPSVPGARFAATGARLAEVVGAKQLTLAGIGDDLTV
ncbi:hypothetical protein [Nakamurella lactea]|nr:hypothetical protein [Nakamurella lactea]